MEASTKSEAPARPIGADRDADRSGVQIPPPAIYIAGFACGLALEAAFPISGLPSGAEWTAGLAGAAIWLGLDGSAMARFMRARTSMVPMKPSTALVTSGPYRFTRNPMYLGMAALYAGLALAFGAIWSLALLPAVLLVVDRYVIAREERYLERKFEEQYVKYKAHVRRWL